MAILDDIETVDSQQVADSIPTGEDYTIEGSDGGEVEISEHLAKDLAKSNLKEKSRDELEKDSENLAKWKKSASAKGEKLNTERAELETSKKEFVQSQKDWQAKQTAIEQNKASQSQNYVEQQESLELQRALTWMDKNYEGFDYKALQEFVDGFDDTQLVDRIELIHLAQIGSQIEEKIKDAKTQVMRDAKGKRGLPAGGKRTGEPEFTGDGDHDLNVARNKMQKIADGM